MTDRNIVFQGAKYFGITLLEIILITAIAVIFHFGLKLTALTTPPSYISLTLDIFEMALFVTDLLFAIYSFLIVIVVLCKKAELLSTTWEFFAEFLGQSAGTILFMSLMFLSAAAVGYVSGHNIFGVDVSRNFIVLFIFNIVFIAGCAVFCFLFSISMGNLGLTKWRLLASALRK